MKGEVLLKENNIIITEIVSCYEDVTNTYKWICCYHYTSDCSMLFFGLEGETLLKLNDKEIRLRKNDIVFLPPRLKYGGECIALPARFAVIKFKTFDESLSDEAFCFSSVHCENYSQLFHDMIDKYIIGAFGYNSELKSILYRIINTIQREYMLENGEDRRYRVIKNSVLYFHENYNNPNMSVKKAAEISNLSEVHFRRLFKAIFNVSPHTYVNRIRLKKSGELLLHTEYSMEQIADAVGYSDGIYFSKFFKKETGISPGRYRKKKNCETENDIIFEI